MTNEMKEQNNGGISISKDELGNYYLGLSGVGLSPNELNNLISRLKANGTIPENANVITSVLPSAPTQEMIDAGNMSRTSQLGDYTIKTTDGKNFEITDKEGNLVNLDSVIVNKDEALEQNYNMANDPNAEPDLKPRTR